MLHFHFINDKFSQVALGGIASGILKSTTSRSNGRGCRHFETPKTPTINKTYQAQITQSEYRLLRFTRVILYRAGSCSDNGF